MAKHTTIWKSYGMYSLEELEQYEKAAKEMILDRRYDKDITEEDITDSDIQEEIYQDIDFSFDAEECNLNKELNGRILCIADMGLWDGRRSGYKILGNNLNEVLTCGIGCDEKEVYCDAYNVYARGYHHDGSNSVEFREIREDKNIDNFLGKLYNNEPITRAEIRHYTKSLRPYVKAVYGV